MHQVIVADHPLVKHRLTVIRDKDTSTRDFRQSVDQISTFLLYEATRDVPLQRTSVETPVAATVGDCICEENLVVIAILRAGLGMVPAFLNLYPGAKVGHIGMFRDEESLQPVQYYVKVPAGLEGCRVLLADPMLATGGSLVLACDLLKQRGAKDIRAVSIIAAPEGIKAMAAAHPDVAIYTAAIDSHLNSKGYIVPGLGDAGDRQFGTNGVVR